MDKVKITYAIELDEVPSQTEKLYQEAIQWLRSSLDGLEEVSFDNEEASPQSILKKIDKARRIMGSVDQRLDDCISIISGYHQAMLQINTPQPTPPPQDQSNFQAVSDQLRELQEQTQMLSGGEEDD
jgi:hypothetical protein